MGKTTNKGLYVEKDKYMIYVMFEVLGNLPVGII